MLQETEPMAELSDEKFRELAAVAREGGVLGIINRLMVAEAEVERLTADRADLLAACEETFAHLTGWAVRFEADGHLAVADVLQRDVNRLGVAIGKVKDREG